MLDNLSLSMLKRKIDQLNYVKHSQTDQALAFRQIPLQSQH